MWPPGAAPKTVRGYGEAPQRGQFDTQASARKGLQNRLGTEIFDQANMPSTTEHTPRKRITASAIVCVWLACLAYGMYAGNTFVRDYSYARDVTQEK